MIEEMIDFVKKNKLFVICLVIIVITYCNKKKSLENFSEESEQYPNLIDKFPCDDKKNKEMEHCKRGYCNNDEEDEFGNEKNKQCKGKTIEKDGNTINLNYCAPSKVSCDLMNNDMYTNNLYGNTCAECNEHHHCEIGKFCMGGYCEEIEKEDDFQNPNFGNIKVGAKCNGIYQCGYDKYCKNVSYNACLGTCEKMERNNFTCEKHDDCESNKNGKSMCGKDFKCISNDEFNFNDIKERYNQLYSEFKNEFKNESSFPNKNLGNTFNKIKNCLKGIVDNINSVKNSNIVKMKELNSKYFTKLINFYNFISENEDSKNEDSKNEDSLIIGMEKIFCTN